MSDNTVNSKMEKLAEKKRSLPGANLLIVLAIVEVCFLGILIWTHMIPGRYLILIGVCLVLVLVGIALLVVDFHKKVRFIIGMILSLLIILALVFISMYVVMTKRALTSITQDVKTEYSDIGVWVRTDDPASTLADAEAYKFAALTDLDRVNTERAISAIESDLGTQISVEDIESLTGLVDALLDEHVDAIILNMAYLDILEDMEDYQGIEDQIRQLETKTVEMQMENTPEVDAEAQAEKLKAEGVYCIYVGGSDSRGSIESTGRNDVNLIITANMNTREMLIVSTPRDYYVPLSISRGKPDKLTHAGIYGFNVARDTLEMLYDIDIDYTFRINFAGFEKVVDALGGIDVSSDVAFDSSGYAFKKGENHLNGKEALVFCRERYSFKDGDRQRGKNQMAVLKAIISKATSPSILTGFGGILSSVMDCVQTDIPYMLMTDVVKSMLEDPRAWKMESFAVNGTGDKQVPFSMSEPAYVMQPDMKTVEEAKAKMAAIREKK